MTLHLFPLPGNWDVYILGRRHVLCVQGRLVCPGFVGFDKYLVDDVAAWIGHVRSGFLFMLYILYEISYLKLLNFKF